MLLPISLLCSETEKTDPLFVFRCCIPGSASVLVAELFPFPPSAGSRQFSEKCVMNNYFGIGLDAKISLEFNNKRDEHPKKCR